MHFEDVETYWSRTGDRILTNDSTGRYTEFLVSKYSDVSIYLLESKWSQRVTVLVGTTPNDARVFKSGLTRTQAEDYAIALAAQSPSPDITQEGLFVCGDEVVAVSIEHQQPTVLPTA